MRQYARIAVSMVMATALLWGMRGVCLAQGAAVMEFEGRREVTLKDGTKVILLPAFVSGIGGAAPSKLKYYYLPTNLHLSRNADGTPQFLFLKFTTEKSEAQGGINGALMHFLTEYGLSAAQMAELQEIVRTDKSRAVPTWRKMPRPWLSPGAAYSAEAAQQAEIIGPAPVVPDGDTGSFVITSATLTDAGMTKSLVTSGKAPLLPGQRVAAAARLTANGAQLLASTFEKTSSITDVSLSYNLAYYAMLPAVKGHIKVHSEKLKTELQTLTAEYYHMHKEESHGLFGWGGTTVTDESSYKDNLEKINFLRDKGIVEVKIENQLADSELANKVIEAFLQIFLTTYTEKPRDSAVAPQDQDKENGDLKAPEIGSIGGLNRRVFKKSEEIVDREWNLEARLPIKVPLQLTGNLREWYDNVRDNPKCVASVNLNDPFFTHRDIKFIMDLDAKEIFEDAVNYVTINVRKKRTTGRDFEDHVTIDSKYLKENGVTASVTYARGEDKNPDLYEYQAQWSLKGGNVYPQNPAWQKGSWEGVTLTPPVRPLTIEVEGDADAMKAKDVVRIVAQVHYYQFDKEAETNIQIAPGKTPVSQKIFIDRGKRNYAYRLIFYHKTAGRLVGPWVPNVSDEYIYCNIPEDLLTLNDYKERAKGLGTGVMEKVLDKLEGMAGGLGQ